MKKTTGKARSKSKIKPKSKGKAGRQIIRAAHWKRPTTIAAEKFNVISRAIMAILPKKGMGYGDLVDKVEARTRPFEGSVWWYTITCLRELETQGKVKRDLGPPVRYSKK